MTPLSQNVSFWGRYPRSHSDGEMPTIAHNPALIQRSRTATEQTNVQKYDTLLEEELQYIFQPSLVTPDDITLAEKMMKSDYEAMIYYVCQDHISDRLKSVLKGRFERFINTDKIVHVRDESRHLKAHHNKVKATFKQHADAQRAKLKLWVSSYDKNNPLPIECDNLTFSKLVIHQTMRKNYKDFLKKQLHIMPEKQRADKEDQIERFKDLLCDAVTKYQDKLQKIDAELNDTLINFAQEASDDLNILYNLQGLDDNRESFTQDRPVLEAYKTIRASNFAIDRMLAKEFKEDGHMIIDDNQSGVYLSQKALFLFSVFAKGMTQTKAPHISSNPECSLHGFGTMLTSMIRKFDISSAYEIARQLSQADSSLTDIKRTTMSQDNEMRAALMGKMRKFGQSFLNAQQEWDTILKNNALSEEDKAKSFCAKVEQLWNRTYN